MQPQHTGRNQLFFSLSHYGHFLAGTFWPFASVVLKLAATVFISLYFRHSDRNDLIFFGHLKEIGP